jgi:hypothetical protein
MSFLEKADLTASAPHGLKKKGAEAPRFFVLGSGRPRSHAARAHAAVMVGSPVPIRPPIQPAIPLQESPSAP